jgi:hypothetical protein
VAIGTYYAQISNSLSGGNVKFRPRDCQKLTVYDIDEVC